MRGRVIDKAFAVVTVVSCSYIVIHVFIPFLMEVFGNGGH
jgi:hypothetical protein